MIIINYWNISAGYNYPYRHPFTLLDECTGQLGHQLLQSSDLIHKLPFGTADCFDNVRDIYYRILLSQSLIKCIIASILPLTFGCSNGSPSAAPRPLPACINCSGHSEAQTRLTFSRWRHRTVFFFFSILLPSCAWALVGPRGTWTDESELRLFIHQQEFIQWEVIYRGGQPCHRSMENAVDCMFEHCSHVEHLDIYDVKGK